MNNKKINITLTIMGISILVMATIGATFAYFTSTSTTTNQNVQTGRLVVDATATKLNAENIKPTTWDSLVSTNVANTDIAQIRLSVNTYGTSIDGAKYNIYLTTTGINLNSSEALTGGALSDIKWKLINASNELIGSGNFASGNYNNTKLNTTPITINNTASTVEEATDTYILFIYIEDNGKQDKLQNLQISATTTVRAEQ